MFKTGRKYKKADVGKRRDPASPPRPSPEKSFLAPLPVFPSLPGETPPQTALPRLPACFLKSTRRKRRQEKPRFPLTLSHVVARKEKGWQMRLLLRAGITAPPLPISRSGNKYEQAIALHIMNQAGSQPGNTPVLDMNLSLPWHYFITLQHIMTHAHRVCSHLQALVKGFTTSLKIRVSSYHCAFVTIYIRCLALSISPALWFTALQTPDISKLIQGLP